MPPQNADAPGDTPRRVRHPFDKIIGKLNGRWNLELPSLHGTQQSALEQTDATHSLATRCAGRIRYLCFRCSDLDKVISEFEEDAHRICSGWVWKPSQEEGTLPPMSVTKSFISTRPALSLKHRHLLLECLFVLLDDEFKLAYDSDVYDRTTSIVTNHAAASAQRRERQSATSAIVPRPTTPPETTRRRVAETEFDDTKEARSRTRRSRDVTKRKTSGPEKV